MSTDRGPMDNIQQPQDPRSRGYRSGNGERSSGEEAYQPPSDTELSPEVQLMWFELNREQTLQMYARAMKLGGSIGALLLPLVLLGILFAQVKQLGVDIMLPEIHPDPMSAALYWALIGVLSGFLVGALLAALGLAILQWFR